MEIQDLPYVLLVNYHGPNDEQGQLCTLNEISDKLKTLTVDVNTRLIWRGDWNCILDESLDAMGESPSLKKESVKLIQNLMNDFNLVDVWRLRNPTYKKFSWRRTKPVTTTPQYLLRFPHFRRLLEGPATGSLIAPLSMTPLLLKKQKKLLMRLQ